MRYEVRNIQIHCPICKNDRFDLDYRQLNTRAATFFNFDWANREVAILVCKDSSHIAWFMEDVKKVG